MITLVNEHILLCIFPRNQSTPVRHERDIAQNILQNRPSYPVVFPLKKTTKYVTSAAFGYTVRKSIAYSWLPSLVVEGTTVEIEYFRKRIRAALTDEPLYDPKVHRLADVTSVRNLVEPQD